MQVPESWITAPNLRGNSPETTLVGRAIATTGPATPETRVSATIACPLEAAPTLDTSTTNVYWPTSKVFAGMVTERLLPAARASS